MSFTIRGPSFASYGTIGRPSSTTVARIPRSRPPGATGTAVLRWGAVGDFQAAAGGTGIAVRDVIINFPAGGDEAEDDFVDGLVFTEKSRETTTVRITNPLDTDDFVDVERIDKISFDGPDGRVRTFVLNN